MSESQDHFDQVEKEIQKVEQVPKENEHVPERSQGSSESDPEHILDDDEHVTEEEEDVRDDTFAKAFLEGIYTVVPALLQEMLANVLFPEAKNPNRMLQNRIKKMSAKDPDFNKQYEQTAAKVLDAFHLYQAELSEEIEDAIEELVTLFTGQQQLAVMFGQK